MWFPEITCWWWDKAPIGLLFNRLLALRALPFPRVTLWNFVAGSAGDSVLVGPFRRWKR